jgi:flagellar export protein FliJ
VSAFRFRLGRVLRARRATEEIERGHLAEAEASARQREVTADQRAASRDAAVETLRGEQMQPEIDASRVLVAQDAAGRLAGLEQAARALARTARDAAESRRAVWRDARAGVLGLERLEDRDRARFRAERDIREERTLEEVAARRAEEARRRSEAKRTST